MRAIAKSIGLVAVLLIAASAAPAAASSGAVNSSGACTEALVSVPVESDDVVPFLPAGTKPSLTGGKALLSLFAEQCSISLEGHEASPTKLGGAIMAIDFEHEQAALPCPGATDDDNYAFFWTTDRDALSGAWSSVGFFHGLVRGQTFEASRTAVDSIKAAVPFEYSSYSLEVRAPVPTVDLAPGEAFGSRHWQHGSKGWIRATFAHKPFLVSAGSGEVHVEAGTPLYRMLGGRKDATGIGLIGQFDYSGPFELCAK